MKKLRNILVLVLAIALAWMFTAVVFRYLQTATVMGAVKFLVAAFAPIGTVAGQMLWKVHDATKTVPSNVSSSQIARLRGTADMIMWRLWILIAATIIGSALGAATGAFEQGSATALVLARVALSLLAVCLTYTVIYLPWLHFDLVALERRMSTDKAVAERKKAALDKLSVSKTP